MTTEIPLDGWDIGTSESAEWMPWVGSRGNARAKVLATADGYTVVLVEAEPGYAGAPHEHAYAEFSYVIDGEVRNQGVRMVPGYAYAAAQGSRHTDFETDTGASYIVVFKI